MTNRYRVEKWNHPYPPNPAKLRLDLESEGFRVSNWCDFPETAYGMHKHSNDQTHWIISGSIEITVANIAQILSAGDRDHMPANTYHTARVIGDEPVKYLIGEKDPSVDAALRARNSEALIDGMIMMEKILADTKIDEAAAEETDADGGIADDDEVSDTKKPAGDEKSRDE